MARPALPSSFWPRCLRPLRDRLRDPARRLRRIAELADRHEQRLRSATDADLGALAEGMRARLRRDGFASRAGRRVLRAGFAKPRRAASASATTGRKLLAGWALLQAAWSKWKLAKANLRRYAARVHGGARGLSGARRHRERLSRPDGTLPRWGRSTASLA